MVRIFAVRLVSFPPTPLLVAARCKPGLTTGASGSKACMLCSRLPCPTPPTLPCLCVHHSEPAMHNAHTPGLFLSTGVQLCTHPWAVSINRGSAMHTPLGCFYQQGFLGLWGICCWARLSARLKRNLLMQVKHPEVAEDAAAAELVRGGALRGRGRQGRRPPRQGRPGAPRARLGLGLASHSAAVPPAGLWRTGSGIGSHGRSR